MQEKRRKIAFQHVAWCPCMPTNQNEPDRSRASQTTTWQAPPSSGRHDEVRRQRTSSFLVVGNRTKICTVLMILDGDTGKRKTCEL